jgi:two-component system chemotaxis response regulator CheB
MTSLESRTGDERPFWLIAVAGSAGGLLPLLELLSALPTSMPAAVVVVQHRTATGQSKLRDVLARRSQLPVVEAQDGQPVAPGAVYIARADAHLTVDVEGRFAYRDGTRIRFVRSSANPLLESAAALFDGHVIAIVLSGGGADATDGVQAVKAGGGWVIAQDPASAIHRYMPQAAIDSGSADYVLPAHEIATVVQAIVSGQLPAVSAPVA